MLMLMKILCCCSVTGLRGSHVVNICMMDDVDAIKSHRYGLAYTHQNVKTLISLSLHGIPYHANQHIALYMYITINKKILKTMEVDHHFSYIITQIHSHRSFRIRFCLTTLNSIRLV